MKSIGRLKAFLKPIYQPMVFQNGEFSVDSTEYNWTDVFINSDGFDIVTLEKVKQVMNIVWFSENHSKSHTPSLIINANWWIQKRTRWNSTIILYFKKWNEDFFPIYIDDDT